MKTKDFTPKETSPTPWRVVEKLSLLCFIALVMWRERPNVRWERTVAPRRAGTKGKGSILPLCSGGGAIAHNASNVAVSFLTD